MAHKWHKLMQRMGPKRRARVEGRARRTLASMPLPEIRQAIGKTQIELAAKLGQGQGSISKIENAADLYLTTLRKYIRALGGEPLLKATFPGGREIVIDHPADLDAA